MDALQLAGWDSYRQSWRSALREYGA